MRSTGPGGRMAFPGTTTRWRKGRLIAVASALLGANAGPRVVQAAGPEYAPVALRVADALLARQDAAGAIPDSPGGETVNEDSNMEYALVGIPAGYWRRGDA